MDENTKVIMDKVEDGVKTFNDKAEKLEKDVAGLNAEIFDVKQKMASMSIVNPSANPKSAKYQEIYDTLKAKNAVTVNGTGNVNVVQDLWQIMLAKSDLLSAFTLFTGRDAKTAIPVWGTPLNASTGAAENATITPETAGVSVVELLPKQYGKILPVSWEALMFSAANLEAQLPELFSKAFKVDILDQVLNGDGTGNNMTGLFLSTAITNDLTCAAAGFPKIADLLELALTISGFTDNGGIIMNPSVYSAIMGDTTAEMQVYKEEMARNKTIEGVKIYLTSKAPKVNSAGATLAVGGDLSSYALAVGSDVVIKTVESATALTTNIKAAVFANGAPVVPGNFYQLKAHA